jgi:HSP20 family protein
MSMTRYEPWTLVSQLQSDLNRMFDTHLARADDAGSHVATSDWSPAVDIREEAGRYVIAADIPGVDPADIEITMEDGVLTIRGERRLENREQQESYRRVERVYGTFYRRFSMPDNADPEQIEARGRNGVLEITIPKQERVQRRTIKVGG